MSSADTDRRMYLLEHNRDAVMIMLGKTLASGLVVDDVVAIVADTTDVVGGLLAKAMAERHDGLDAETEAARTRSRGQTPTLVACVESRLARALFNLSNPSVSEGIDRPVARDRLRVVVVGAGGSTLVHVPIHAMPDGGSA